MAVLYSVCSWMLALCLVYEPLLAFSFKRDYSELNPRAYLNPAWRRDAEGFKGLFAREKLPRRREVNKRGLRVSFKECNLEEGSRLDCGTHGITEELCQARECCWGESQSTGVPWCYHSITTMHPGCLLNTEEKVECGPYGIRKEQCLDLGCCWQPGPDTDAPWCYERGRVPVYKGECGVPATPPSVMTRIVGGVDAVPHSWPWMASFNFGGGHMCGASIINNQWLVTAAHCEPSWLDPEDDYIEMTLGMHSLSSTDENKIHARVAKMISHELYGTTGHPDHDVMVVKLTEPIEFNDTMSPICLADPDGQYNEGRRCYTTGWGRLSSGGALPDKLQQVMVPLIATDTCNGTDWYDGVITDTMLCAGYMEGGRDSCQGDSGGPLVCNDHGVWTQVGIVSWGYGCAGEKLPGVYSRVTELVTWIENTIADNY